jgi:sensor histidine kinase YesM
MRLSSDIPIEINFSVQGEIHQSQIAPLILIPFIENAFKYGISLDQPGEIQITLSNSDKQLEFQVQNGIYDSPSTFNKKNSGIGLVNVKKRLDLLYPGRYILNIEKLNGKFLVKLVITLE